MDARDHFTFLGYREYELPTDDGEDVLRVGAGLGARDPARRKGEPPISASFARLPPEVRRLAAANTCST